MMGVSGTPEEGVHKAPGLKVAGFNVEAWGVMEELGRSLRLPDWGRIQADRSEA